MNFSVEDLRRVVLTVWSTQIRLELDVADAAELEPGLQSDDTVSVEVDFVGEFNGRIVLRCSRHVSLSAAAAAFATSGNEVGASDIRDTVAEMAHMTAGNLKSLLSGSCKVCNPGQHSRVAGVDEVIARAGFTFEGEPLIVDLIQTR